MRTPQRPAHVPEGSSYNRMDREWTSPDGIVYSHLPPSIEAALEHMRLIVFKTIVEQAPRLGPVIDQLITAAETHAKAGRTAETLNAMEAISRIVEIVSDIQR